MTRLSEHPTVKRLRDNAGARASEASTLDASWLREVALASGADDVGFVGVDRPEIAAEHEDIRSLFPEARTLLSFVCRMNRENVRSPSRSLANCGFRRSRTAGPSEGEHPVRAKPNTSSERRRTARPESRDPGTSLRG
jgi:hypothetical protein